MVEVNENCKESRDTKHRREEIAANQGDCHSWQLTSILLGDQPK